MDKELVKKQSLEVIEEILPERRTNILIEKDLTQGFDYRRITIEEQ